MTSGRTKYRSLFLSDMHLGSRNCKAERLYKFLCRHRADRIYLIGDIIEGHHIGRWPKYHDLVIRELSEKGLDGTEIIYIPGNHDCFLRHHIGVFGNLHIRQRSNHFRPDGSIWLVAHGDETDFMHHGLWLWFLVLFERLTGRSLWEMLRKYFSGPIKRHGANYERKMRKLAEGYGGVICGHVHSPKIDGNYINAGDWTKHCTAVAEHHDGRFELLMG